mgnify:FL=1
MNLKLAAPSSQLPTVNLPYGSETYRGAEKFYPLGQRARTDDNRIFYFAQNDSGGPLNTGELVAAPVKGQVVVIAIKDGKPVPHEIVDGFRYGVVVSGVAPGEYFWAQTWGEGPVRRDPTIFSINISESQMGAVVSTPVGYVEEVIVDGMSSAYLTVSP